MEITINARVRIKRLPKGVRMAYGLSAIGTVIDFHEQGLCLVKLSPPAIFRNTDGREEWIEVLQVRPSNLELFTEEEC